MRYKSFLFLFWLCLAVSAQAVIKTFYFLPPADEEWQQGLPMMVANGGIPVLMETDAERCGWFKAIYYSEAPPTDLIIVLNSAPDEYQLGANGVEDEVPAHIDLKARFEVLGGNTVFFDADGGSSGWTVDDPGTTGSCGYSLAALVYDSDASLHGAFSCDAYPKVAASSCYTAGVSWPDKSFEEGTIPCMGVKKGVVGSVLDQGKKPMYNAASGCFESAAKFQQLFSETPGVNVKHCIDFGLSRSKNGYWKYDSMDEKDQGFFPLEWESNSGAGTKRVAYGGMAYGDGNGTAIANSAALAMKVSNWAALDAVTGLPFIDLYPAQDGEFDTGDNPNVYDNMSWDTRVGRAGTVGSEAYKGGDMKKNQHFCMESHASFEYRRGQFLSLRGDDDIWVYIDNRLAIDLGGMHLPAPGLVYLDTMGLNEGTKYDLDLFACDRRTEMSNLSVKTNIYFDQRQDLFVRSMDSYPNALEICKMGGSGSSCDAMQGDASVDVLCGGEIADQLAYFLTSRRAGDTLWLDESNPRCAASGSSLTCYGGIQIGAGKVSVETSKITDLTGSYVAWAKLEDPANPLKARIRKFTASNGVAVIATKVLVNGTVKDLAPPAQVVAGKRVPIYFAYGESADGVFQVDEEGGAGRTFQLDNTLGALGDEASLARLRLYRDSLGAAEALSSESFTIGAGGLCTLWVQGNYEATGSYTYRINVAGARTGSLALKVVQPVLEFRDASYEWAVHAAGPYAPLADVPYVGEAVSHYLVALDPVSGAICASCNFSLSGSSSKSGAPSSNPVLVVSAGVKNGKAVVDFAGKEEVAYPSVASVIVQGPSPQTRAAWDSLGFKAASVPVPVHASMHDKNGDGRPDSLVIAYSRPFASADSLPSLRIVWPVQSSDTMVVSRAQLHFFRQKGYADSLIVLSGWDFSKGTSTLGPGLVLSEATVADENSGLPATIFFQRSIDDRVAPVVKEAYYSAPNGSCGSSLASACLDKILVSFSEPLSLDSARAASVFPLAFRLSGNAGWSSAYEPMAQSWNDSTAVLFYQRYKGLPTPVALDSIRLAGSLQQPLLHDAFGNYPGATQQGVSIRDMESLAALPEKNLSRGDLSWTSVVEASRGTLVLRDLQGRALWSASLPVSPAQVRARAAVQGRLCLLHIGKRAWLVSF